VSINSALDLLTPTSVCTHIVKQRGSGNKSSQQMRLGPYRFHEMFLSKTIAGKTEHHVCVIAVDYLRIVTLQIISNALSLPNAVICCENPNQPTSRCQTIGLVRVVKNGSAMLSHIYDNFYAKVLISGKRFEKRGVHVARPIVAVVLRRQGGYDYMRHRLFRYLAAIALCCMSLGCSKLGSSILAGKDSGAQLRKLQSQVEDLERRVGKTEDFIALSNLEDAYGYYLDKCQWDQAADLFAKDGRIEVGGRGVYIGQDRVRAFMQHLPKFQYGQVFNHMQLQPVITVGPDGKSAQARWRAIIQAGVLNKYAQWGEGTYENEFIKENGVWKFKSVHFFVTYYIDYDKGWDKGGNAAPAPIKDLLADRPSSVNYKPFPDVFIPPYHYKNPVTGK
jgi:hypothetical protein